jgi:conjugal transfer mating pair stabilization protein TraN
MPAKTTHYLGSRCTDRFFGFCILRLREYCVYESKLGRVFQEQAHKQIGGRFRARGSSDRCPPLTIDQLESLNMGEIDLSEIYGDMLDQADFPLQDALVNQLNNQLGVTAGDVQSTFE